MKDHNVTLAYCLKEGVFDRLPEILSSKFMTKGDISRRWRKTPDRVAYLFQVPAEMKILEVIELADGLEVDIQTLLRIIFKQIFDDPFYAQYTCLTPLRGDE